MDAVLDILREGLVIAGFVLIMMLVIEYLNVLTRGNWDRVIARWTWGQSALGAFLGAMPGCLGAYAVASLYMHRVITVGALLAAMVATCGDESFLMLALFPGTALKIFGALFAGGVLSGVLFDLVTRARRTQETEHIAAYSAAHTTHPGCVPFSRGQIVRQWKHCSAQRGWLALFLTIFLAGIVSGEIRHNHALHAAPESSGTISAHAGEHAGHDDEDGHDDEAGHPEWNWVRITLLVAGLIALAIVATVPDHFLEEHLWHHLVKQHAWRVLLWTLGALAVTQLLVANLDLSTAVESHRLPVLLIACLVGVLPASGPHFVFVTLYAGHALPLSTLVANCIVQDGHGMIPTLAHSRRAFLLVKGIKMVLGLGLGMIGHAMGW